MRNRGKYRFPISIYVKEETEQIDELGEKIVVDKCLIKNLFADFETRAGSLLSGRPADTVMSKVTAKFSYPFNNFPIKLLPAIHWIEYKNEVFQVEYFLNQSMQDIEAEVFVSEDTKGE